MILLYIILGIWIIEIIAALFMEHKPSMLCLLLGHKRTRTSDKDMFNYEYVWQKEYCKRCGKTLN